METTIHAIVLRRKDAGETDRRLTVLSEELGKIEIVAKGARKAASRLAGSSDPLAMAVFSFAAGKKNRFVTQVQPLSSFRGLRTDYDRLSLALALCELYAAVLPWEEPQPEAYALLVHSLRHLEAHEKPLVALAWGEVQLLDAAGFTPQLERCVVTDAPIQHARPFLSPTAGGYVCEAAAGDYRDRFRSRAEVLYGLSRLSGLPEPPKNLKFAEECLADLLPFWQNIAESPLPANQAAVAEFRHNDQSREVDA